MTDPIRVVLVDDHPMLIDGLRLALDVEGISVVGVAGTAAEAAALVGEQAPDVVVMDVHLPDGSGIHALPRLLALQPRLGILMLTMAADDHLIGAAMAAGASGYLLKGASREEIVRAIRAVADGQVIFGSSVGRRAVAGLSFAPPFPQLTQREREVLALVAAGHDNPAIARTLRISAKTAANHVSAILVKLGAADRTQAALIALKAGL
ncbi:response regulator transcription factor [Sphaerimonospora thailandensis]|uniref:DNA-binding response regulator n=1 Tax=Sphaerimonospora thailandensis TaxID=795644 RepID=A0A8J3RBI4_9ACTN|nr:response regulator transcription factor [Sphaerimonospora thailandensis]GIH71565.1 DNA-binding response regulator [Sphaerimonospora thailandensis]